MRVERGTWDIWTMSFAASGYTCWLREMFEPVGELHSQVFVHCETPENVDEIEVCAEKYRGPPMTRILLTPSAWPLELRPADFGPSWEFRFRLNHKGPAVFRLRWFV